MRKASCPGDVQGSGSPTWQLVLADVAAGGQEGTRTCPLLCAWDGGESAAVVVLLVQGTQHRAEPCAILAMKDGRGDAGKYAAGGSFQ